VLPQGVCCNKANIQDTGRSTDGVLLDKERKRGGKVKHFLISRFFFFFFFFFLKILIRSGIPKNFHHPGGALKFKEACTLLQVVILLR
jgi:hypothetical protein